MNKVVDDTNLSWDYAHRLSISAYKMYYTYAVEMQMGY